MITYLGGMPSFPSPLFVVLPEEGGGVSPRLLAAVIAALDTREHGPLPFSLSSPSPTPRHAIARLRAVEYEYDPPVPPPTRADTFASPRVLRAAFEYGGSM